MSRQRKVPQFINIEDKIAFQLTAKQLGWVGVGCLIIFLAWVFLEKSYFIITAVIVGICVVVILFIKPFGQTLPVFIGNAIGFLFKPKVYIWRKGYVDVFQEENFENRKDIKKLTNNKNLNKKSLRKEDIQKAIKDLDIYE